MKIEGHPLDPQVLLNTNQAKGRVRRRAKRQIWDQAMTQVKDRAITTTKLHEMDTKTSKWKTPTSKKK